MEVPAEEPGVFRQLVTKHLWVDRPLREDISKLMTHGLCQMFNSSPGTTEACAPKN